jgi:hypothetical protein
MECECKINLKRVTYLDECCIAGYCCCTDSVVVSMFHGKIPPIHVREHMIRILRETLIGNIIDTTQGEYPHYTIHLRFKLNEY